ncbi:hypothetical protein D9M71_765530 [compost metagenome]
MHQHQVDVVGLQALEAAFDGKTRVSGAEVEARLAAVELFAHLADNHPLFALATQQWAETFFASAVGGCGVDQVDAQLARLLEQHARLVIVGDGKAVGVLDPLVAAQLDRAQAQR